MSSVPAVLHVCIVMVCCVISVPHGRACVHCVMSDGDVCFTVYRMGCPWMRLWIVALPHYT